VKAKVMYGGFVLHCITVTSPSPGSSTGIDFVYNAAFGEQDDGHRNLSRYAVS